MLALGCTVWAALAACGALVEDDAAAVVGRVKEGMESQAAGVQAMSTQASGAPPAVGGASGLPPDQVGRAARDEVARTLGVRPEQVSVESVEPVQWTDASLGCAEPGKAYAPAVAPGFRVLLTAAGQPRSTRVGARRGPPASAAHAAPRRWQPMPGSRPRPSGGMTGPGSSAGRCGSRLR